jgi:hypothetical protein
VQEAAEDSDAQLTNDMPTAYLLHDVLQYLIAPMMRTLCQFEMPSTNVESPPDVGFSI